MFRKVRGEEEMTIPQMTEIGVYKDDDTIYFLDGVDSQSVHLLDKYLNEMIRDRFINEVNLVIDSLGGSLCGAYDLLKSFPLPITTWVRGYCCSSATVMFLAGKKRYISPTSLFLIHSARSTIQQEFKEGDAIDFKEMIEIHNQTGLMNIYKKETKIPKDVLSQMSYKEIWITPEQCVDYKIAHGIKTYSKYSV